jgi:hypothetical protein
MLTDAGITVNSKRGQLDTQGGPDTRAANFPRRGGGDAAIEFAISSPGARSIVSYTARTPLYSATIRENQKIAKYANATAAAKLDNLVAVVEVSGAFGKGLLSIIDAAASYARDYPLSRFHSVKSFWSTPTFQQYWRQRISIALRQASAAMAASHGRVDYHKRARIPFQRVLEGTMNAR